VWTYRFRRAWFVLFRIPLTFSDAINRDRLTPLPFLLTISFPAHQKQPNCEFNCNTWASLNFSNFVKSPKEVVPGGKIVRMRTSHSFWTYIAHTRASIITKFGMAMINKLFVRHACHAVNNRSRMVSSTRNSVGISTWICMQFSSHFRSAQ